MSGNVPESDWKAFRELREVALERFCKRVLEELDPLTQNSALSYHERYVNAFRLLKERDQELARAFDDPRRSRMIEQLADMCSLDLLEPVELARFTARTHAVVEKLAKEVAR